MVIAVTQQTKKVTVANTRNFVFKTMVALLVAPLVLTLASNDWQTRLKMLTSTSPTPPSANQTPTGTFDYVDYTGYLFCIQIFELFPRFMQL